MFRLIILVSCALLYFSSCNESPKKVVAPVVEDELLKDFKEGVSIAGYAYDHHVKNNGETPKEGAMIIYHQKVQMGDSVIFSTRNQQKPREAILPSGKNYPTPPPPDYVALRIMSAGDSLSIYQPLASIPVGKLPPNMSNKDTIIHHLKLIEVKQPADLKKEIEAIKAEQGKKEALVNQYISQYRSGALKGNLTKTSSGLEYIILKEGKGAKPKSGQYIKVHYSGVLSADRTAFDNTFVDGRPYSFQFGTGQVIKGWDEGIGYLKEGEQAIFFIPYTLGYGAEGREPTIPEKADLVFFVELTEIL